MALVLVQVRPCDQSCCREGPRFPNAAGDDCTQRTAQGCRLLTQFQGRSGGVGELQVKENLIPAEGCIVWPRPDGTLREPKDIVKDSCADWPHNTDIMAGEVGSPRLGKTGNCCWQWQEA